MYFAIVYFFSFFFLNIFQIALKFPSAFWRKKIREADYFGHVPGTSEDRGLFSVFYDVSKDVSLPLCPLFHDY